MGLLQNRRLQAGCFFLTLFSIIFLPGLIWPDSPSVEPTLPPPTSTPTPTPPPLPTAATKQLGKIAIILTSTINVTGKVLLDHEVRKAMYLRVIDFWLNSTNFPIFLVESSGINFAANVTHPRFTSVTKKIPITPKVQGGQAEALSVLLYLDSGLLDEYDFIFKITCKYFLPNFQSRLEALTSSPDMIFPAFFDKGWQNSEYFGFKKHLGHHILDWLVANSNDIMEVNLHRLKSPPRNSYNGTNLKWINLPQIDLLWPVQRSHGDFLTHA